MNKLLFLYIEGMDNFQPVSMNLSNAFEISLSSNKLIVKSQSDHFKSMLGDNIVDMNVIAGENGVGKTTLLHMVTQIVAGKHDLDEQDCRYLAIAWKATNRISIINRLGRKIDSSEVEQGIVVKTMNQNSNLFRPVIYYSPFLDFNPLNIDRKASASPVMDISLTQLILTDMERGSGKDGGPRSIYAHRFENTRRQFNFITGTDKSFRLPFALPQRIELHINRLPFDDQQLSGPLRKLFAKLEELAGIAITDNDDGMKMKKSSAKLFFLRNLLSAYFAGMAANRSMQDGHFRFAPELEKQILGTTAISVSSTIKLILDFFEQQTYYESDLLKKLIELFFGLMTTDKKSAYYSDKDVLIIENEVDNRSIMSLLDYFDRTAINREALLLEQSYRLIDFKWRGLSSGEKSFLDLFSRISAAKDKISPGGKSVLVILDEGEMGFHPSWQIEYVRYLRDFFNVCFKGLEVQLLMATHSPLVLSDFPKARVHLFKKENKLIIHKASFGTFAQNTSVLLSNDFFVNKGLIGDLARAYIDDLFTQINQLSKPVEASSYERLSEAISQIDEPIIQKLLANELFRKRYA